MDTTAIRAEITSILREILRDDSLAFGPGESLVDDHGLDSLDLIDLAFHIEERLGVRIGANELSGRAKTTLTDEELIDDDGLLTERALAQMRERIPEIPPEKLRRGLRRGDIPRLLTLDVFVRIVAEKRAEAGKNGPTPTETEAP